MCTIDLRSQVKATMNWIIDYWKWFMVHNMHNCNLFAPMVLQLHSSHADSLLFSGLKGERSSLWLLKVCRQRRKTFLFLLCFLLLFFLIFLYQPHASLDFSLISHPISVKFGLFIVLDKTDRCLKFQVNRARGRDKAWSQSFTMLYNRKNSIYCA